MSYKAKATIEAWHKVVYEVVVSAASEDEALAVLEDSVMEQANAQNQGKETKVFIHSISWEQLV